MILNQEQIMLRETVGQFFEDQSPVSRLRGLQQRPVEESYDRALWSQMAGLGSHGNYCARGVLRVCSSAGWGWVP